MTAFQDHDRYSFDDGPPQMHTRVAPLAMHRLTNSATNTTRFLTCRFFTLDLFMSWSVPPRDSTQEACQA